MSGLHCSSTCIGYVCSIGTADEPQDESERTGPSPNGGQASASLARPIQAPVGRTMLHEAGPCEDDVPKSDAKKSCADCIGLRRVCASKSEGWLPANGSALSSASARPRPAGHPAATPDNRTHAGQKRQAAAHASTRHIVGPGVPTSRRCACSTSYTPQAMTLRQSATWGSAAQCSAPTMWPEWARTAPVGPKFDLGVCLGGVRSLREVW